MFSLHAASTSLIYDTLNSQQVISFCNYVIYMFYCVRQNQQNSSFIFDDDETTRRLLLDRINEIEGIAGG